jgi:hypothetical protein
VFGQVVDTLDKWLNRPFLLAYFSPWLIFAFANGVMAYITFPQVAAQIDRYVQGNPADKAIVVAVAIGAIGVVSYVSSLLLRGMTRLLEGRWLPEWLADQMTALHAEELSELEQQKDRLSKLVDALKTVSSRAENDLMDARSRGELGRRNLRPEQIKAAAGAVAVLWRKWYRNQLVEPHEISDAIDALAAALASNCADPARLIAGTNPLSRKLDTAWSQKLHIAHHDLVYKLLPYALDVARERHNLSFIKRYQRFAKAELAPTRIGNDAATLRSYCDTRYNLDFDFFWPRLQIVIQKDQNLNAALVNSKTQLDFVVLLFWLTLVFTGIWLLALTWWGNSLWAFVFVAALGPLACRIWLGIVQASYAAFTELARSAIDLKRLDLLTALHWPLPLTADAELRTWKAVGERMSIGPDPRNAHARDRETVLRHPAAS